jgi:hypothetical protein
VYRISAAGEVEVFYRGLGRPQGLAFDAGNRLYVAASLGGRRGVVRLDERRKPELFLSGPNIAGLAFTPSRSLMVADMVATRSWFFRSTETLRLVAGDFKKAKVKAAIEPIRAAEVSFCHTIADAQAYIAAVNHPGVQHINGDVYHMQSGESHIGEAILAAGERLTNLHMADSNRCALGDGALDVDTLIMALYCIGYNQPGCYVTPEPLGPGGDPYPAMNGKPDPKLLDRLVGQTARYFREREEAVRAL